MILIYFHPTHQFLDYGDDFLVISEKSSILHELMRGLMDGNIRNEKNTEKRINGKIRIMFENFASSSFLSTSKFCNLPGCN